MFAIALSAVLIFGAPTEGTPALKTEVERLIPRLDHDDQAVRDAAEKSLLELGTDVLEYLPPPDAKVPLEIEVRVQRLRVALEKELVESFTRPTTVTLQGEMKVSAALAEMEKQTHNKFVDFRERFNQEQNDPTVKLDLHTAPFWQGVDALFDSAQLSVYNYNETESQGKLPYVARAEADAPRSGAAVYASFFRLQPKSLEATRHIGASQADSLRVNIDLAWEPRIRPIVLLVPQDEVKAIDDTGENLLNESAGTLEIPVENSNAGLDLSLQLSLPKRERKQITSLSGSFDAIVPGRVETFEFTKIAQAKNASLERGGAIVTLEQARVNDDVFEVRMRLKFDKSVNALESHRGWVYNNEAYLIDAAGQKIENGGLEARLVEENEVGFSYMFDLTETKSGDLKFVYKTPAAIFKVPVKFELKNLELP